jgi:hypothetical protein
MKPNGKNFKTLTITLLEVVKIRRIGCTRKAKFSEIGKINFAF